MQSPTEKDWMCARKCMCFRQLNRLNIRWNAIMLGLPVHLSQGLISDLKHWRGWPANDEAISTTGLPLWVGGHQPWYYQQRSPFRALLTQHHCLVVSIWPLSSINQLLHASCSDGGGEKWVMTAEKGGHWWGKVGLWYINVYVYAWRSASIGHCWQWNSNSLIAPKASCPLLIQFKRHQSTVIKIYTFSTMLS